MLQCASLTAESQKLGLSDMHSASGHVTVASKANVVTLHHADGTMIAAGAALEEMLANISEGAGACSLVGLCSIIIS